MGSNVKSNSNTDESWNNLKKEMNAVPKQEKTSSLKGTSVEVDDDITCEADKKIIKALQKGDDLLEKVF